MNLPFRFFIFALVLGIFRLSTGEESGYLAELKEGFESAFYAANKPIRDLNSSYAGALERLAAAESAKGNLDSVLQVREELKAFGDGSEFDATKFLSRETKNQTLEKVRVTYLNALEKHLSDRRRVEVIESFRKTLEEFEQERTKSGDIEVALAAREVRQLLDSDPKYLRELPGAEKTKPFEGRIHLVAKGDIELLLNGERISYRNDAREGEYVNAVTRPREFKAGDVLQFNMSSAAVFRHFILAIQSDDGSISIPIRPSDYRFLGSEPSEVKIDPKALVNVTSHPEEGSGDTNMVPWWSDHDLTDINRTNSEWAKIPNGKDTYCYAILIQPEMIVKKSP